MTLLFGIIVQQIGWVKGTNGSNRGERDETYPFKFAGKIEPQRN